MARLGYVPSLLCAEFVMDRVCHVPSLLCAKLSLNPQFYSRKLDDCICHARGIRLSYRNSGFNASRVRRCDNGEHVGCGKSLFALSQNSDVISLLDVTSMSKVVRKQCENFVTRKK